VYALVTLAPAGCGGSADLASVEGRVTLGSQPLADAEVTFAPVAGKGSPSYGRTDSDGNYSLVYSRDDEGAEIGEHLVFISTYQEPDEDAETPTPGTPERVPVQYAAGQKVEVKPGSNKLDFPLTP
jgi:hypothetical protein